MDVKTNYSPSHCCWVLSCRAVSPQDLRELLLLLARLLLLLAVLLPMFAVPSLYTLVATIRTMTQFSIFHAVSSENLVKFAETSFTLFHKFGPTQCISLLLIVFVIVTPNWNNTVNASLQLLNLLLREWLVYIFTSIETYICISMWTKPSTSSCHIWQSYPIILHDILIKTLLMICDTFFVITFC